jgi:hypothetical protein
VAAVNDSAKTCAVTIQLTDAAGNDINYRGAVHFYLGGVNGDTWSTGLTIKNADMMTGTNGRFLQFDQQVNADLDTGALDVTYAHLTVSQLLAAIPKGDFLSVDQLAIFAFATTNGAVQWGDSYQSGRGVMNLRRLNKRGNFDGTTFTPSPLNGTHIQVVLRISNAGSVPVLGATTRLSMAITDAVVSTSGAGSTLSVAGSTATWTVATGAASAVVTAPMLTMVGTPVVDALPDSTGIVKFTFTVGGLAAVTAGSYNALIDFPTLTAAETATIQTVAYKVSTGDTGVSNADVLKAIVSLIASINKQIAALQKALLKR